MSYEYTSSYSTGIGWDGGGYSYSYANRPTGDWPNASSGSVATRPTSTPARAKPPTGPTIQASSGWMPASDGAVTLSRTIDDVVRAFGLDLYDQMMTDDQVSSSVNTLIFAVLGGELSVEPAIQLEPGETVDDPKKQADIDTANRAADLVRRSLARVPDLDAQVEAILSDGVVKGAGLADRWWITVQGPNDDKPVTLLGGILVRPRESWDFVVNAAGQVTGIAGYATGEDGGAAGNYTRFDRDRFLVHVNAPRRGDPRGTSDLRPAYDPWNLKIQARPQRAKWVNQFANPTVKIVYDPTVMSPTYPIDPATGLEDTTQDPYTAQQQAEGAAYNFQSSSYLVLPKGCEAELVESSADGGGFATNEDAHNNAIAKSVLLTSRATNSSDANSQADAGVAQKVMLLKVNRRRAAFAATLNADLCKPITRMNLGDDAAERLCPKIVFRMDAKVQAEIITALTGALNSKAIPNRIKPKVLAQMGFPGTSQQDFDEMDEKAAKDAAANAAKAAAIPAVAEDAEDDDEQPTPGGKSPKGKRGESKAEPAGDAANEDETEED